MTIENIASLASATPRYARRVVSPRTRVAGAVAATAALAAAGVVGVTLLQTHGEQTGVAGVTRPQKGTPPLFLDFGVRTDAQAAALRRATGLYTRGDRAGAARIFDRYRSLDARIGAAFARWPDGSLDAMK